MTQYGSFRLRLTKLSKYSKYSKFHFDFTSIIVPIIGVPIIGTTMVYRKLRFLKNIET